MKHKSLLTTLLLSAVSLSAAAVHVPTLQLDSVVNDYMYEKVKEVYSVDETGQHQVRRIYLWERNSDRWIGYEMYEQTLNDKGYELDYTFYRGSTENDNWYKVSKNDNTYDDTRHTTVKTAYIWDVETSQWKPKNKTELQYDTTGRTTANCYSIWNSQQSTWTPNWQTDPEYTTQYHYSPYTAPTPPEIDNKLQVFLDPNGNILYVDDKEVSLLGTSQEKPVRVYDVSGGLQILSSARIINLSELPNGLYFVTVNGQTRRVMKR